MYQFPSFFLRHQPWSLLFSCYNLDWLLPSLLTTCQAGTSLYLFPVLEPCLISPRSFSLWSTSSSSFLRKVHGRYKMPPNPEPLWGSWHKQSVSNCFLSCRLMFQLFPAWQNIDHQNFVEISFMLLSPLVLLVFMNLCLSYIFREVSGGSRDKHMCSIYTFSPQYNNFIILGISSAI